MKLTIKFENPVTTSFTGKVSDQDPTILYLQVISYKQALRWIKHFTNPMTQRSLNNKIKNFGWATTQEYEPFF